MSRQSLDFNNLLQLLGISEELFFNQAFKNSEIPREKWKIKIKQ